MIQHVEQKWETAPFSIFETRLAIPQVFCGQLSVQLMEQSLRFESYQVTRKCVVIFSSAGRIAFVSWTHLKHFKGNIAFVTSLLLMFHRAHCERVSLELLRTTIPRTCWSLSKTAHSVLTGSSRAVASTLFVVFLFRILQIHAPWCVNE